MEDVGFGVREATTPAAPATTTSSSSTARGHSPIRARAGSPKACADRTAYFTPPYITSPYIQLKTTILYKLHINTFTQKKKKKKKTCPRPTSSPSSSPSAPSPTGPSASASGPRARRRVVVRVDGDRPPAGATSACGVCEGEPPRATTTSTSSTATGRSRTRARAGSPRGCAARRGSGGAASGPAPGIDLKEAVLYELHIGTFTREGTFDAAIEHLRGAARSSASPPSRSCPSPSSRAGTGGATTASTSSAAHSAYGGPEGFQRFVEAAHDAGLGVILDVVYNHVGASGVKALEAFGPYFTDKHETFWGKAINFDDEDCGGVREWVLQSAEYWVGEMGVDGLRVDAIHAIKDDGARHILSELADRVHAANPNAVVIAESALNDPKVIRPDGHGHDAQWADDFHHCVRTLLTGEREGYYSEYGELWPAREGVPAAVRVGRHVLAAPPPPLRRAGGRPRPRTSSSSSPRTTTTWATARSATACPADVAAARRVLRPTVSVRADALPGRGIRRARALPVLQRPHRRGDRDRDPRRAPARVRPVRGLRGPGPRPAGPARRSSARS